MNWKLNNGVKIPAVGFGVWQVENPEVNASSVQLAIETGYRAIDTAAAYGNEESTGEGIRRAGVPREQLFVTTKLWNACQGYDTTLKAFEESMARLKIDYLDLYLIHWPGKDKYIDTWKAFEKLYKDGRIKAIGVSNFMPHHLASLINNTEIIPAVNQIELHPYLWQTEAIKFSSRYNILLEAWSPLAHGGAVLSDPIISAIAQKHGKGPAQVILRWLYQKGVRTLCKSVTPSRIKENFDIFDFVLSPADVDIINKLDCKMRTGPDPDAFFLGF